MTGGPGAVLTLGVGAALLVLAGAVGVATVRAVLGALARPARLGCGWLLLALLLWWLASLGSGGGRAATPPVAPSPRPVVVA